MAEQYRKWYSFAMTYYDDIYEHAVDHHYLISTDDAARLGIPGVELAKLAYRGRLESLARGLYRLSRYVPSKNDPYAIAVAQVGSDAYLYGESVIAMLGLAPTNPAFIYVASPRRVRKRLSEAVRIERARSDDVVTTYEGIPCQAIDCAIEAAADTMMDERLREAAARAREQGLLTAAAAKKLEERMGWR